MIGTKYIAVICNYVLKPERIGGMDRFFVAYDSACKERGLRVDWFFSHCKPHSFYENLNVFASENTSAIEQFFNQDITSKRYDIVITHFVELCTPMFRKIKTAHHSYIIAIDHNPRPIQGFPLKKRIKNRIKGRLYGRNIDCFGGVSQYTVDHILMDYGKQIAGKTHLVYNGIDTSIYKKRTEENFGRMIVASHLRESKGIQDLIEAVNLLSAQLKNMLKIDIFGEGPSEKVLKAKVADYNLEQQIVFNGSSSKLPELLQGYSFLLQPTYMECFSLSILESLAANVPVITTPVGGNPEIIINGYHGFLFKAGDIRELASILEKVLEKDLIIGKDVSTKIVREFSLEKMVQGHLKLLPCT
ncbi:glycosyltransferase family 4 protein [Antarcticibacterium arcticum]|uniref:Glycosyltransferase family 4 protein n=1 Tax=Antarcticibacterium arcticum TaxID=2585771 RepID=A0A5B8YKL8_9FLAO|nr:glycosyltransferase family 4 protein [Antarcticibacterium arcticum]QED37748.1 glycosyltransferase family 4 protein [Antarcticibacterium arcticum]